MRRLLLLVSLMVAVAGCGKAFPPVTTGSAPATTPDPPPAAAHLTLSGAVVAELTAVTAESPCGAVAGGYTAELRFQLEGRRYSLTLTLPDYRGPGSYPAPPDRVALHTAGFGTADPVFFSGVAGAVTVNPDGLSGTVSEDLQGDRGPAHVSGSWRCQG